MHLDTITWKSFYNDPFPVIDSFFAFNLHIAQKGEVVVQAIDERLADNVSIHNLVVLVIYSQRYCIGFYLPPTHNIKILVDETQLERVRSN